jgi:aromatic-L-amino-acid decarboxylase
MSRKHLCEALHACTDDEQRDRWVASSLIPYLDTSSALVEDVLANLHEEGALDVRQVMRALKLVWYPPRSGAVEEVERKAEAALAGVPMQMRPCEMRSLGYDVVDRCVAHFCRVQSGTAAVGHPATPEKAAVARVVHEPEPPRSPTPPAKVLEEFERATEQTLLTMHPRFFAYVPGPNNFASVMADTLASATNIFSGSWQAGAGWAQIELTTLAWLTGLFGLPTATAGGIFVSGGSVATMCGLAVARSQLFRGDSSAARAGIVYGSAQCHSSVNKALRLLGFDDDQWRELPCRADFKLDVDALCARVAADRLAGRTPFCVVLNGGATNTGAVDDLEAVADVCGREKMWMHVDAAYGGGAILIDEGRRALRGIERADSITIDPHKWLFQPYECACLLVRDESHLAATFHTTANYLPCGEESVQKDCATSGSDSAVYLMERGPQMTRSCRALKLWMSLKVFGLDAFSRGVARGCELARSAEAMLRAEPCWRIVTGAQLGVVTFRWQPPPAPPSHRTPPMATPPWGMRAHRAQRRRFSTRCRRTPPRR